MKKSIATFISAATLACGVAWAEQEAGDREAILAGSGLSSEEFDSTSLAVTGQVGWFIEKELELGLRQNIGFADSGSSSQLNGATRVFADYHFDFENWQPFLGASLGMTYGAGINDTFIVGPEGGVKYFVKPKTFIIGQVSYLFQVDQDAGDGSTFYTLGVGFNF